MFADALIRLCSLSVAAYGGFALFGCAGRGAEPNSGDSKTGEVQPEGGAATQASDCNFVNYNHDEAKNAGGARKCATDCDCDGMRTCVAGTCEGTARPAEMKPENCNNKDFRYNEAWTAAGPGTCTSDCECDGLRSCKDGKCEGTAR